MENKKTREELVEASKNNKLNHKKFKPLSPQDEYAAENEWYWHACYDEEKYEDHFH